MRLSEKAVAALWKECYGYRTAIRMAKQMGVMYKHNYEEVLYWKGVVAELELLNEGEDTVNLEVKFDRKTAKKLEKLAKKWNLSQEETLVRILTEITATPRDLTHDELAAFE